MEWYWILLIFVGLLYVISCVVTYFWMRKEVRSYKKVWTNGDRLDFFAIAIIICPFVVIFEIIPTCFLYLLKKCREFKKKCKIKCSNYLAKPAKW